MPRVTAAFEKLDDKKHSIRFQEAEDDPAQQVLGAIYIKRHALALLDNADGEKLVYVTLEVKD